MLNTHNASNLSQESTCMDLTVFQNNININIERNDEDDPPKNYGKVGNLRSVQEIPKKYRHIFKFPFFNIIQSNVIDDVLYTDNPLVVSAPTGSGKTIIFEIAIIRLLRQIKAEQFSEGFKIIYVAPIKALCAERLEDWYGKFSEIGLSCIVMTGDSDNVTCKNLKNYHIILTTPEKLDAVTRCANEATIFIKSIKLFMIDEVHLLNEERRGPTLEAIVSRIKLLKGEQYIRFIAVSATIPNAEDIAEWLSSKEADATYYKIGDALRPVKLNKIILGYPCPPKTLPFKFDITLVYKLPGVLLQYSNGKPTLIFCSTRKGVEMTSKHLSQSLTIHLNSAQKNQLAEAAKTMFDNKMRVMLMNGVGMHHAGMSAENRNTIEKLFRDGVLPILVATSTLAMGVNLPAHLVIIKSTQQYVNGRYQNYSESTLLQMIGRAGRPQFDTHATVVIMTKSSEKERYEKMVEGSQLVESNLHRHLTQHLNSEIVLHVITDIAVALEWIRSTFLYVRVLKNPKHYNMPHNESKEKIEKKLQDLCQIEINALDRHGMLEIDKLDGFSVIPTKNGILMANYYLDLDTMKIFLNVKGNESFPEILNLVCNSSEFSEVTLRVDDKRTLNTLNSCKYATTIRFPLPGNIKTKAMKVNCIIQAIFGCLKIQDPSLFQEASKIMRNGERICKALVVYLQNKEKFFTALLNALTLSQCFHAQLWENSIYLSKQLNKIGVVMSSMLANAGKTTFKSLLETNPRDIERIINRAPPMGNDIQDAVAHLPFYRVELKAPEHFDFRLQVLVTLLNSDSINKCCTAGASSSMTLLVGDSNNNVLLCKTIQHSTMILCKENSYYVELVLLQDHTVYVHLISENWVGIDCHEKIQIILQDKLIQTNSKKGKISIESKDLKYNCYGYNENILKKSPNVSRNTSTSLDDFSKQQTDVNNQNSEQNLKNRLSDSQVICDSNSEDVITQIDELLKQSNKNEGKVSEFLKPSVQHKNCENDKTFLLDNSCNLEEIQTEEIDTQIENELLNVDDITYSKLTHPTHRDGMKETENIITVNPNKNSVKVITSYEDVLQDVLYPFELESDESMSNFTLHKDTLNEYLYNENYDFKPKINSEIVDDGNDSGMIECLEKIENVAESNRNICTTEYRLQTDYTEVKETGEDHMENLALPRTFKEYVQKKILQIKKEKIWKNKLCDFEIGVEEFIMSAFDSSSETSENEEVQHRSYENPLLHGTSKSIEIDTTTAKEKSSAINEKVSIKTHTKFSNSLLTKQINNCFYGENQTNLDFPRFEFKKSVTFMEKFRFFNEKYSELVLPPLPDEYNEIPKKLVNPSLLQQFQLYEKTHNNSNGKIPVEGKIVEKENRFSEGTISNFLLDSKKAYVSSLNSIGYEKLNKNKNFKNLPNISFQFNNLNKNNIQENISFNEIDKDYTNNNQKILLPIFKENFIVNSEAMSKSTENQDFIEIDAESNGIIETFGNTSFQSKKYPSEIDLVSPDAKSDISAQKKTILPPDFYANLTFSGSSNDFKKLILPDNNNLKARIENVIQQNSKIFPSLHKTDSVDCYETARNIIDEQNTFSKCSSNFSKTICKDNTTFVDLTNNDSVIPTKCTSFTQSDFYKKQNKPHPSEMKTDVKNFLKQYKFQKSPAKKLEPISKRFTRWKEPIRTISGNYKKRRLNNINSGLMCFGDNKITDFDRSITCTSYTYSINNKKKAEENVQMSMIIVEKTNENLTHEKENEETNQIMEYNVSPESYKTNEKKCSYESIQELDISNNTKEYYDKQNENNEFFKLVDAPPTFSMPDFQYKPLNLKNINRMS